MPPFRQARRAGSSPRADTMSTFAWAQCRSGGRDTVRCNSPARTPSGRHLTGHRLALIGQARSAASSSGLFSSPSYHWPPQPVLTT